MVRNRSSGARPSGAAKSRNATKSATSRLGKAAVRSEAAGSARAKLFMHGRSQAVRLPKEFRFEGSEVRVRRIGEQVILEPLSKAPFDYDAWLARMRAYDDIEFPEVTDDDLLPVDNISFD